MLENGKNAKIKLTAEKWQEGIVKIGDENCVKILK